ncbi:hypothetical protein CAEBREN_30949 [Caenorhabditis brenneri]|uniref:Uncharacterized protein n=1 Tax=Caenorhabditis brenneri TaxID=135651 RepID=G0N2P7_CAEBE|nr:hypothetical protein CAEBREN_30949 [Caenorhabditis brenneri]
MEDNDDDRKGKVNMIWPYTSTRKQNMEGEKNVEEACDVKKMNQKILARRMVDGLEGQITDVIFCCEARRRNIQERIKARESVVLGAGISSFF